MAGRAGAQQPLSEQYPPARSEHAMDFSAACRRIGPVMYRADRPDDRDGSVGQWQVLRASEGPGHLSDRGVPAEKPSQAERYGGGIYARNRDAAGGGHPDGRARPAADVRSPVAFGQVGLAHDGLRNATAAGDHRQRHPHLADHGEPGPVPDLVNGAGRVLRHE
jgi:hypothetical protein